MGFGGLGIRRSQASLLILAAASAKFLIHLATAANYGYFCDELYSLALSRHLAFGYVDVPPLMPALLAANTAVLGDSLLAIHLLPALAGAATLVLACLIAREFGGGLFAIGLCGLAFIVVPFWLSMDSYFGYDAFDQLALAALLYLVVRLLRSGDRRLWLLIGLTAGLACLTKTTVLFLGPGFLAGLLASKLRRDLLSPWPYAGAALFLVVVSPYVAWEYANGFPTLEYWAGYRENVLYAYSPWQFLVNVILAMNPALLPLLVAGFAGLVRPIAGTSYRSLLVMFAVTALFVFYLHAKVFMLLELFIPVIAAGSAVIERWLTRPNWSWARLAAAPYLIAAGLVVLPAVVPVLPLDAEKRYADAFRPMLEPFKLDNRPSAVLPEVLANRLGWEGLVKEVAGAYAGIEPATRSSCGIYAGWYGPAGAIDLYGPRYGLPHAASGFLNYFLWGPGERDWNCMILVGDMPRLRAYFTTVELKATYVPDDPDYLMPYNRAVPIYVCRGFSLPLDVVWPYLKNFTAV